MRGFLHTRITRIERIKRIPLGKRVKSFGRKTVIIRPNQLDYKTKHVCLISHLSQNMFMEKISFSVDLSVKFDYLTLLV